MGIPILSAHPPKQPLSKKAGASFGKACKTGSFNSWQNGKSRANSPLKKQWHAPNLEARFSTGC
jgi:hypothetical protein